MADHTFLQMTNGSIKEIDPVDETMNMIAKHRTFRPNSFADVSYHASKEQSPEYVKMTRDNDEVTAYMEEFEKTDAQNVQIDSESDSESSDDDTMHVQMPHENDTEDIADTVTPDNYNHKHSKEWNNLVEKKAREMEAEEAIQKNMKLKAKQAKEEAAQKAARERAREHQSKLMQLEREEHNKRFKNPSVDFAEMYSGMSPSFV